MRLTLAARDTKPAPATVARKPVQAKSRIALSRNELEANHHERAILQMSAMGNRIHRKALGAPMKSAPASVGSIGSRIQAKSKSPGSLMGSVRSSAAPMLRRSIGFDRFGAERGSGPVMRKGLSTPIRRSYQPGGSPGGGGSTPAVDPPAANPGTVAIGQIIFRFSDATSPPPADPAVAHTRKRAAPSQPVRRAPAAGGGQAGAHVESLMARSTGEALSGSVRSQMEAFFGSDFSDVRVHRGGPAADAARSLNAQAFTTGEDIFFGHNFFDTSSSQGQALIGHELTHVMQNRAGVGGLGLKTGGGGLWVAPHDRLEVEAEANEARILSGLVGPSLGGASSFGSGIQRKARASGSILDGPVSRSQGHAQRIQRKSSAFSGQIQRKRSTMHSSRVMRQRSIGAQAPSIQGTGPVSGSVKGEGSVTIGTLRLSWSDSASDAQRSLHRKPESMALAHQGYQAGGGDAGGVPAGFGQQLKSSAGSPLPHQVRGEMESLFGMDFGGVRVHVDPAAQQAADAIGAEAFTLGEEIYFNANRFAPNSSRGMALLAHELTHVAQAMGGAPTFSSAWAGDFSGDPSRPALGGGMRIGGQDALEQQADINERMVEMGLLGGPAPLGARPMVTGSSFYPGMLAMSAQDAAGGAELPAATATDPTVNKAVELFKTIGKGLGTAADIGIGFVPIVGDVYDALCGLVGRALFTWQKLDVWERILCFAGIIPIPFVTGALLRRGKRAISWMVSEGRALRILNDLISRGTAFVKKHFQRLRDWFSSQQITKRMGRGVSAMAAFPAQVAAAIKDGYTAWKASKRGTTPEGVKKLQDAVERLGNLMRRHGLNNTTQAAYYEYRALRAQGYSAKEAHDLMKRFRAGEEVEGFAWHFTDLVGGEGVKQSGKLRAGKGYLGQGVYAGSTPTPSVAQQRVPLIGWGLDTVREVRIPVKMGDEKKAFEAILPSKTYLFEVSDDMPLVGGISDIARKDNLAKKTWDRFKIMALAAAGFAAVAFQVGQWLFKSEAGTGSMAFADRLRRRRKMGRGADDGIDFEWLSEWSKLDPSQRQRLTRVAQNEQELERPGLPLEFSLRNRLEGVLGSDLSDVRVHTGLQAERLATAMQAQAFTFGNRIVMGSGSYQPESVEGFGTLVHEATHVLQGQQGRIDSMHDTAERTRVLETEAYARERAFVAGARQRPAHLAPRAMPEPVFREAPGHGIDDLPVTTPKPAVPASLSKALAKAVDERPESVQADQVQRVMKHWGVGGLSREEFLEECKERIIDLMYDEMEMESERGGTLVWNANLPLA